MAKLTEFESLDEEVKELLENYKFKRATVYEPCLRNNYMECLIGLSEELGLYNINYTFNPHVDVDGETLNTEALVKLINAAWTLLHKYKNMQESTDGLKERNHILEQSNKSLNDSMSKLKQKNSSEKNESRACVASAQRVSDQSNEVYQKLIEARTKLNQITKQKEANEKYLHNKIAKLKLENNKLLDKVRGKTGTYTSCAEVCDSTITQLKEKDRRQRSIIAQLQANNQELLQEVIAIKEELLITGLNHVQLEK